MQTSVSPATLKFLKDLSKNNDRDWFNAHKQRYLDAQENMVAFVDRLIIEMNKHDELNDVSGKKSLYRIYKDVRFSKDKSPYNPRFAFSLQRATKLKRGGYYMNIKPGGSFLGCGFFSPNPADLNRIRLDIADNYQQWNKILKSKNIKANFGTLSGETVNTAPRGFDINHPAIELLRHKQFILRHYFTDAEVTSPNFLKEVNAIYKSVRPFFNYMSEVLTTNLNGELIV
ncbi:MAG: hypothetical protein JWO06_889 [Bacteroidota bacterium]|nr:hypothetical protein [Bacteroidota bacterium]